MGSGSLLHAPEMESGSQEAACGSPASLRAPPSDTGTQLQRATIRCVQPPVPTLCPALDTQGLRPPE